MALEVLEHIEDDRAALEQWARWLRPGGVLLLSVPAHMARWNARDVWAGHYRRYERPNLENVLDRCGLEVRKVECYGVPLANLLERLAHWRYRAALAPHETEKTSAERTARSGVDRGVESRLFGLLRNPLGVVAMRCCCLAQVPFLGSDLGSGYIALAVRP